MKKISFSILLFIAIKIAAAQNNNGISSHPSSIIATNTIEFIENKGQVIDMEGHLRPDILYIGDGAKVFLRKGGLSYVMTKTERLEDEHTEEHGGQKIAKKIFKSHRVDVDFVGADPAANIKKEYPAQEYFNYYLGHCADGITNVKAYNKIAYEEIYKNIDVAFYGAGQGRGLEYDFIVKPGGDPSCIVLKYNGMDGIILSEGKLKIKTTLGELTEWMPRIYQTINEKKVDIEGRYDIKENLVKIKVGKYDKNIPLIIDPWITYYGGTGDENGKGITTDTQGNALVTGNTYSPDFPVTPGAFQTLKGVTSDVYIVKFNSMGVRQWSTFFGGNNAEMGWCIATDDNDNVVATGYTASPDFPVTSTAFQTSLTGGPRTDAFVIKLDPLGNRLWATFFGGSLGESGNSICTDINDNILFSGYTASSDFPVTPGAHQTANAGGVDVYVTKLAPDGSLVWSTYYGSLDDEYGRSVTTDTSGDIGVTGTATANFPITPGAFQMSNAGMREAFLLKLDVNGNLVWSTFYGGTGDEEPGGIAADNNNNLVIIGETSSAVLPATTGTFQPAFAGRKDVYIAKFNSLGNLLWSSYYGGGDFDFGYSIAIDTSDNIFISGDTYSIDFPVTSCAFQTANGGGTPTDREDIFVIKLDSTGNRVCATYLGGSGHDEQDGGHQIAVRGLFVYIIGQTPGNFPVTPGVHQPLYKGGQFDLFIAQLCALTCGTIPTDISFSADKTTICTGVSINFTGLGTLCDPATASWSWSFPGGTPSVSSAQNPAIIYNIDNIYDVKLVVTNPCGKDSIAKTDYIIVNAWPVADAGTDTTICSGQSVTLSASGGQNCTWNPTASLNNSTIYDPVATPTVTTTYSVTVFNGTCYDIDPVKVNVISSPIADAGTDVIIIPGSSIILSAAGGGLYSWSPETGLSCLTCRNPKASPQLTTTYYVNVTDASGCTAIDSVVVTVEIKCGELLVPTAFSPNDDGQNDLLFVRSNCIKTMEFSIYNRWGEKVFASNDITQGWNGTYKEKRLNTGIFAYQLAAIFTTGETITQKGNISLIR